MDQQQRDPMNEERQELPIERLLLAFAGVQGEEFSDTEVGAQMMEHAATIFAAAWDWHSAKKQGEQLSDWDRWGELLNAVGVYNQAAKKANLPFIVIPTINAIQKAARAAEKVSLEPLAVACLRASRYLEALQPLVKTALQAGKYIRS